MMLNTWKSNASNLEPASTGYEKLLADDALAEQQQQQHEQQELVITSAQARRRNWLKHLVIDLTIILVVLLIAFLSWTISHQRHLTHDLQWTSCGNSSAEARAAGCHYEPMQRSWIPNACYFPEPSTEYHPFDDRQWYYDLNLTRKLDDEGMQKLRNGDDLIAYTHFFHNEHCVYCWRKLAIAVERRLPMIDSKTANIHHSTHCAHLLSEEVHDVGTGHIEKYNHQATQSPLMFQTCVPLIWGVKDLS